MISQCLRTELVQRDFDKNWELIGLFLADENAFKNIDGNFEVVKSYKWLTLAVYPFIMEESV